MTHYDWETYGMCLSFDFKIKFKLSKPNDDVTKLKMFFSKNCRTYQRLRLEFKNSLTLLNWNPIC